MALLDPHHTGSKTTSHRSSGESDRHVSLNETLDTMSTDNMPKLPHKRLIICCDGTWMHADSDFQVPSNITRISRAIDPVGLDHSTNPPSPIAQVTYCQDGVGTGAKSFRQKYVGGATGEGISVNIREAYAFICRNYRAGDEIILLGFSRGAFTARSVSSMIRTIGVLTAAGLQYLTPIFEDWKFQDKRGWKTRFPDEPWAHRPKLDTDEYRRKLLELEYTRPNIPVKCVAVFDTVGALGVPSIWLMPQNVPVDYQLVNTCIEPNIEYAYQALALDEHRRPYYPTIWEKSAGQVFPRELKQTWFPGVHSDIGGSYDDADLANITLAWMVSQLDHLISFNHEVVTRQIRLSREKHEKRGDDLRGWGLGRIHDSMNLIFRLFGSSIRTPKEYYEMRPNANHYRRRHHHCTNQRLQNTHEYVHSSVRVRMGRKGLGYNDRGWYESSALQGWTFTGTETKTDTPLQRQLPGQVGKVKNVVWKKTVHTPDDAGHGVDEELEMPEDQLRGYERQILALWPDLYNDFDSIRPGAHPSNVRRASTYPHESPRLSSLKGSKPSPRNSPRLSSTSPRISPRNSPRNSVLLDPAAVTDASIDERIVPSPVRNETL